jgi:hypothetical protein
MSNCTAHRIGRLIYSANSEFFISRRIFFRPRHMQGSQGKMGGCRIMAFCPIAEVELLPSSADMIIVAQLLHPVLLVSATYKVAAPHRH